MRYWPSPLFALETSENRGDMAFSKCFPTPQVEAAARSRKAGCSLPPASSKRVQAEEDVENELLNVLREKQGSHLVTQKKKVSLLLSTSLKLSEYNFQNVKHVFYTNIK